MSASFVLESLGGRVSTEENPIVSSSSWMQMLAAAGAMSQFYTTLPVLPDDRCPPTHLDRPLVNVRVFGGHPTELAEQVPHPGGWDIGPVPAEDPRLNHLLCVYGDDQPELIVILPRQARACEFVTWPNVICE